MEFTEFCRKELLPGVCSVSVNRKSSHILRFTPSKSDKRSPSSLKESITTANSEPIMLSNFSKSPKHYSTNYLPNFDKSFETLISSIKRDFSRSCQNLPVTSSPEESFNYLHLAKAAAVKSNDIYAMANSGLHLGDYYANINQYENALNEYFAVFNLVKDKFSEDNKKRILTRINDIKLKIGESRFNELYNKE